MARADADTNLSRFTFRCGIIAVLLLCVSVYVTAYILSVKRFYYIPLNLGSHSPTSTGSPNEFAGVDYSIDDPVIMDVEVFSVGSFFRPLHWLDRSVIRPRFWESGEERYKRISESNSSAE